MSAFFMVSRLCERVWFSSSRAACLPGVFIYNFCVKIMKKRNGGRFVFVSILYRKCRVDELKWSAGEDGRNFQYYLMMIFS